MYITVLVPIAAKPGFISPPAETALLAVQVPPPGVAVKLTAAFVLHWGAGMVSEGVSGLLMVIPTVFVTGQLNACGDTVTL